MDWTHRHSTISDRSGGQTKSLLKDHSDLMAPEPSDDMARLSIYSKSRIRPDRYFFPGGCTSSDSTTTVDNLIQSQSTKSIQQPSQLDGQQFRFMDLPREIRDEIYKFTLSSDFWVLRPGVATSTRNTHLGDPSSLFCTCVQVYEEALPVFQANARFVIDVSVEITYQDKQKSLCFQFLRHIRLDITWRKSVHPKRVKGGYLCWLQHDVDTIVTALESAPHLKSLHVLSKFQTRWDRSCIPSYHVIRACTRPLDRLKKITLTIEVPKLYGKKDLRIVTLRMDELVQHCLREAPDRKFREADERSWRKIWLTALSCNMTKNSTLYEAWWEMECGSDRYQILRDQVRATWLNVDLED